MSNDQIKLSYQPLILLTVGEKPTVPSDPSGKPGDVGWVDATDLLMGQTAYNVPDNAFYVRTVNGIKNYKTTVGYVHDQGTPSTLWTVHHNLGVYSSVMTVNTGGVQYFGKVTQIDEDTLQIEFNGGFSGKAYVT